MSNTMEAAIIYRDGWHVSIRSVVISKRCPVCGGPRGEPYRHRFCEDGEWFTCSMWDNPCGHVDKYSAVWREYQQNLAEVVGFGN